MSLARQIKAATREQADPRRKNCPRPLKVRYILKASAELALAGREKYGIAAYAYRCPCGGWHLAAKKP